MTETLFAPAFEEGLNRMFRGRAKWSIVRDAASRTTRFGFACTRDNLPIISIADMVLEDARDARLVVNRCLEVYERHHMLPALDVARFATPIWTCRTCHDFVSFGDIEEAKMSPQQLFEHCESQAEKWMRRAQEVRVTLSP